jgi:hypothetical protein
LRKVASLNFPGSSSVELGNEYATGKLVQGASMHARFWRIEVMNSGGAGIQVGCVLSNIIGVGIMLESLGMDGGTILTLCKTIGGLLFASS